MPIADLADAREVVIGWDDDPADADDGLGENMAIGVPRLPGDGVFERAGRQREECE